MNNIKFKEFKELRFIEGKIFNLYLVNAESRTKELISITQEEYLGTKYDNYLVILLMPSSYVETLAAGDVVIKAGFDIYLADKELKEEPATPVQEEFHTLGDK